jgi:DNA-binding IclR family transcriptional regulator
MTEKMESAGKTVERVLAVLRELSAAGPAGLALAELSERTQLPKATAHRLLNAVAIEGFVFQDLASKRYRLGSQAAALWASASEQHVAAAAHPSLRRLAERTGDSVFASVREGLAAICVARDVGSFPIRTLTLDVGDRRPLGVGAGSLALLAACKDDEIAEVIRRNERWLQDYHRFSAMELPALVLRTRRDGYALNEGRIVPGMNAIAVAVVDDAGAPLAALSIAAVKDRMGAERIPELVACLQDEARVLRTVLGVRHEAA